MDDEFLVSKPDVAKLAGSFTQRQGIPRSVGAEQVSAASGVSTGDPALDAETRSVFETYQALLDRVGELFGSASGFLDDVVAAANQHDVTGAGQIREIYPEGTGAAHA